jgi:excinuclease UvrABC nuclease subunit
MKEISDRIYLPKTDIFMLPDKSGIYFLFQQGCILVYIGKAMSLRKRVPQHDASKEYTDIAYELCHWSRARQLEKKYIEMFEQDYGQLPYYNMQH